MCGILCCFKLSKSVKQDILESFDAETQQLLKNRGPDKCEQIILNNDDILFAGFVLWHQGEELASQPIQTDNGILLFNGDIFNVNPNISTADSIWLLSELNKCKDDNDLLEVFKNIEGPYSFVYYSKSDKMLYFGRDSLGRNSFVIENDGETIKLSSLSSQISISSSKETFELPSIGIFKMDMNTKQTLTIYPWRNCEEELKREMEIIFHTNVIISKSIVPKWLISVETNDMEANYDFYEIVNQIGVIDNLYEELLKNKSISSTVDELINLLEESIKNRVQKTQKHCSNCLKEIMENHLKSKSIVCPHTKIGILFSGGIDCSILAALSHKYVDLSEPIDLINVAFEKVANSQNNQKMSWDVPDRISAIETFEEFKKLFPERVWNLVEINVNRSELHEKLCSHICNLIYPLNTVLDESIGCAFWFAARGKGTIDGIDYESKSRIILVGIGADELFGGYTRHRNAFVRCKGSHNDKLNALRNELDLDWNRIPARNLGRDDRVIADHGKTARAPFIEENIVHFVRNLQPSQKCCFTLNQGIGDKLLLRLCGHRLGLKNCTTLKKRAIQFGSKIADKRQNATDISKFLQYSNNL